MVINFVSMSPGMEMIRRVVFEKIFMLHELCNVFFLIIFWNSAKVKGQAQSLFFVTPKNHG